MTLILVDEVNPHRRWIMQVVVALFLIMLCCTVRAAEPGPCTPSEIKASNAFWNKDGTPKYRPLGAPPKKCGIGKPRFQYACSKPGGSAAIQFYQDSGAAVLTAATRASEVYAAAKQLTLEAPHLPNDARYLVDAGKGITRPADEVSIPTDGSTWTYLDTGSGLAFSVSVRTDPATSRKSVILAFRGTPEILTPDGDAAWTGTNLPQELTAHDAPMYSDAVVAATSTVMGMQREFGFDHYCNVPIIYTGHSLGGGLALHAALRSIKGCFTKKDAVVVFNPALSTFRKLTSGGQPGRRTLMLAAVFQDEIDFIKLSHNTRMTDVLRLLGISIEDASRVLTDMSKDSQVVLYSNVSADTVATQASHHSMERMLANLRDTHQMVGNGGAKLSEVAAGRLCSWYTPVKNARRR